MPCVSATMSEKKLKVGFTFCVFYFSIFKSFLYMLLDSHFNIEGRVKQSLIMAPNNKHHNSCPLYLFNKLWFRVHTGK